MKTILGLFLTLLSISANAANSSIACHFKVTTADFSKVLGEGPIVSRGDSRLAFQRSLVLPGSQVRIFGNADLESEYGPANLFLWNVVDQKSGMSIWAPSLIFRPSAEQPDQKLQVIRVDAKSYSLTVTCQLAGG
jgi:hypothetical protein